MSLVTRGLGGNALVTQGLGDVWRRILWVMRTESKEPVMAASSSRLNVAAMSVAAAAAASSEEPDLAIASTARASDTESKEPDLDTVTVEPVRQRPL